MIQLEYIQEDLEEIRIIAKLAMMDTVFYIGHCTSEVAYRILKEILGGKLQTIWEM